MAINLPCGNKPLTTNECGGDCDEKIERLAERVSEAEDKLDTIQEGAEVNVNADWDETDPDSDAYIENKPSVNYDLSLGDSAPTVGSAVVGSAVLGTLVDIILGRGDGTEDRVSVSGTGAIQITRDGDTMTIHVPVGDIDQLRNGTDTEARAWAASVLKQWLDERIAQIPADQFLDLNKTVFANPFTWSSTTYPGSINPNLDGKPVLVLALTDGENVSYSFLNMEDLIDAYEGVAPISVNGSQISHDNSGVTAGSYGDSSNQTPNFGDTFKALRSTVDAKGHVTSMSEHTVKIPDTLATQESAGLMSAEDKEKLDNVDQLYKTTCGNPIVIDDADGEVKALNVELTPIQEGTPRQDSTVYNEPYLSKDSPSFNSEYDKLVGGTVAWNQLVKIPTTDSTGTDSGITHVDHRDGSFTLSGTSTANQNITISQTNFTANQGHKVLCLVDNSVALTFAPNYSTLKGDKIISMSSTASARPTLYVANGATYDNVTIYPMVFDLTQMFGATVADAIYALEQNTAGSGIAFLKSYDFFTKDYYPYNEGELISVKPTAHVTSETYPLAGVELRGIPKISNGALYYDGDTYESNGDISRKYVLIDLGTLPWAYEQNYSRFACSTVVGKPATSDTVVGNIICSKYVADAVYHTATGDYDKIIGITDGGRIRIKDTSYTDATTFTQAMSGVMLLCEVSTPTTETVTGFTSPQAVGSTESYTDNRDVPIPVGHESRYADIFPIYPHTSLDVRDTGKNLLDNSVALSEISIYSVSGVQNTAQGRYIYLKAGTYTITYNDTTAYYVYGNVLNSDGSWVSTFMLTNPLAHVINVTLTEGQYISLFVASGPTSAIVGAKIQIEHGDTATSYAPYTGQTVTVPLNDLYGGNVDVIKGQDGQTTQVSVDISTLNWSRQPASGMVDRYLTTDLANVIKRTGAVMLDLISSIFVASSDPVYDRLLDGQMCVLSSTGGLYVSLNGYNNVAEFKAAMAGQTICYPLATPTPLTTTPTPLTLYKGDNVVSSDGDMCITYLQDRGDLTDFISDMKDCCEEVKGSLLEHLVDGSVQGSLRGIDTAQEDVNYTLGTDATALGNGTKASGDYSVAEGTQTEASGLHSHAEGVQTKAMQQAAHAEGAATTANALFAHSEGNATNATAMNAHSEGGGTTASGENAHAEGGSTTASAHSAHAEGGGTQAQGDKSHAEGLGTIANCAEQHVGGRYNEPDPTGGQPSTRGTYVEIIGNGASNSSRSNARTLDWNGNEALQGTLTLGKGTADEVTITAAQLQQLLTLI